MRSFSRSNHKSRERAGFTLLEMLLVIAIIAILAAIVIVAINPARQLAQARNAQRASDINALYKAVQQYYIDEREWPWADAANVPNADEASEICGTGAASDDAECIDLDALTPTYISALPQNHGGENYVMALDTDSRISMGAPGSIEQGLSSVYIGNNSFVIAAASTTTSGGDDGGGEEEPDITALREGLVGYWPLDDDILDYSDSGNDGSCSNCPTLMTGKVGGAYNFDGSNDYIVAGNTNIPYGDSDRTFCSWVNIDSSAVSQERGIVGYGENVTAKYYFLGIASGKIRYSGSWNDFTSNSFVTGDRWTHVCLTYEYGSPQIMKVYIDGNLDTTNTSMTVDTTSTNVRIGAHVVSLGQTYWSGGIDEVSIWDRSLSLNEIEDLYNGGSGISLIQ